MLYNIIYYVKTHDMLCYITNVMLYNTWYVMLYNT